MATIVHAGPSMAQQRRRRRREFRLIFAVCFPFFLVAAILARLLPVRGRTFGEAGERPARRGSIFEEAKAAANTTIPFAFMI